MANHVSTCMECASKYKWYVFVEGGGSRKGKEKKKGEREKGRERERERRKGRKVYKAYDETPKIRLPTKDTCFVNKKIIGGTISNGFWFIKKKKLFWKMIIG